MAQPVLTKREFVERFNKNEFGNRTPTWSTLEEFLSSGNPGPIHIRNRIASGPTWYDVPCYDVEMTFREITERRLAKPEDLYFAQMAPTNKTAIQGEVYRRATLDPLQCGLYLLYSKVKKPMREALREQSIEATGIWAKHLLEDHMNVKDWEWLNHLLDTYEDHVIEFSTYSVEFGTVPGHRSVFWEVRKY